MSARLLPPLLLAASCAVLLTGCGSGSDSGARPGPHATTVTTGQTASTTGAGRSTTAAPATVGPTGPTMFFPDRDAAIQHLVDAWKFANRAGAAEGADSTAVDNLFTQSADGFSLYGCDQGDFDTSTCNYRNRASNLYAQITAEKQPAGWVVTAVYMSTDG